MVLWLNLYSSIATLRHYSFNVHRCQHCRLKKCLTMGMKSDCKFFMGYSIPQLYSFCYILGSESLILWDPDHLYYGIRISILWDPDHVYSGIWVIILWDPDHLYYGIRTTYTLDPDHLCFGIRTSYTLGSGSLILWDTDYLYSWIRDILWDTGHGKGTRYPLGFG